MTKHLFSLIPFPATNVPDITITGKISRRSNLLTLHYSVTGSIEEILFPLPTAHPRRKAELWKQTCFEFFLAKKEEPQYWEYNMSPSGDWNAYRMDVYRRVGFREEMLVQRLQFDQQKVTDAFTLDVEVNLDPIAQPEDNLDIGITAVIQKKDGSETYWALAHPASQADFHMRESFILALAGQTQPLEQSVPGG
jgi:hypothetical protein